MTNKSYSRYTSIFWPRDSYSGHNASDTAFSRFTTMANGDGQNGGQDTSAFNKVNEVRKKIALVEGKRRAMFSSVEREKKSNRELTTQMDDDLLVMLVIFVVDECLVYSPLKDTKIALVDSHTTKKTILNRIHGRPNLDRRLLAR